MSAPPQTPNGVLCFLFQAISSRRLKLLMIHWTKVQWLKGQDAASEDPIGSNEIDDRKLTGDPGRRAERIRLC